MLEIIADAEILKHIISKLTRVSMIEIQRPNPAPG